MELLEGVRDILVTLMVDAFLLVVALSVGYGLLMKLLKAGRDEIRQDLPFLASLLWQRHPEDE